MQDWLLILGSVILTRILIINIRFTKANGYIWRAAIWIWPSLLSAVTIDFIFAIILFYIGARFIPFEQSYWALFVGLLTVLIPTTFEYLVLFMNASERRIKTPLVKILQRLNLDVTHQFARAIRTRMEQDAFDCQTGWGLGLTREQIARKIRILYALHKKNIARKRRDPSFLVRDVGFLPWENFYLLAQHLGRRELRKQLKQAISASGPLHTWDGTERRRRAGTKNDRANKDPNDPTNSYSRCSDSPHLIADISTLEETRPARSLVPIVLGVLTTVFTSLLTLEVARQTRIISLIVFVILGFLIILIVFTVILIRLHRGPSNIARLKQGLQGSFIEALNESSLNPIKSAGDDNG